MLWLIIEAVDDTAHRVVGSQAINARTRHLVRMNMSKLSGEQLRALERSIKDYRKLAENNRFKNVFSDIYGRTIRSLHWILGLWYYDAQTFDAQAMRIVSKSKYLHREEILVWYDKSINNGFAEVVNNIQTIRRMAREFRNTDYLLPWFTATAS